MFDKLLKYFSIISFLFFINLIQVHSENNIPANTNCNEFKELNLEITAYYTPLENQKSYYKGSYESDIKLNGKGVYMASGKKVFMGALAGPRTLKFGTKVYIEGYGVGVIEDRGGNIKDGERVRLDIRMGSGDEGLKRTKQWGRKKLKGYIVCKDSQISLNFGKESETKIEIKNDNSYQNLTVTPNSDETKIKELQTLFKELYFYDGEIDGIYENIKNPLIKYQIVKGIVETKNDDGAGYFGPKTRNEVNKDFRIKSLTNKEKELLKNKMEKIKSKLGEKYQEKIIIIIDKIKGIKKEKILNEKLENQLEFLEMIL